MKTYYISNWESWIKVCEDWGHDPYESVEFGIDEGGGNSSDFKYIGDVPEKKD